MNEITLYDRIQNPIEAVEKLGEMFARSGMFGCTKSEQGQVLALACLTERKTPFEIQRTYHIVEGKLSMRADAMLAEFEKRGGEYEWLKQGDDGIEAQLKLEKKGKKPLTVSYTIEDAKKAQLVKPNGAWVKNPGAQLRARATSKGLRMFDPSIVAGMYTEDETESFMAPAAINLASTTTGTVAAAAPVNVVVLPIEPAKKEEAPAPKKHKATVTVVGPSSEKDIPATVTELAKGVAEVKEEIKPRAENVAFSEIQKVKQLIEGHEDVANQWMRACDWIKPEETFLQLREEHIRKILAKPEAFKKALGINGGAK